MPFPEPPPAKDCLYKVSYARPARCNVVGSYVSKTIIKSQTRRGIDMIVEMPRHIFQEKDYLDLRYFYKRAYYLGMLSAVLRDELSPTVTVAYEYLHGNRLLPVLVLSVIQASTGPDTADEILGKLQHGHVIRVIPSAPEGLFPSHKLSAASCCVRAATEGSISTPAPTPFYNSTLKAESCYSTYLKIISHAQKTCPSFRDACVLGRVWLQQRGLGGSVNRGGFGHFEWAALTALLLHGGGRKGGAALSPSLNCVQIFKALIQYLAAHDLSKKPLIIGPLKEGVNAVEELGPIILDATRQLNLAYKMSVWSASMLQRYAKWTNACLNDPEAEHFSPTFITKVDLPLQCFDLVVQIDEDARARGLRRDYRGEKWAQGEKIARILAKALGDRADVVLPQVASDADTITWRPESSPDPEQSVILVGIIFNALNITRQVDHGPTVEEKEAAKRFRQFWGDRAELRRFRDGNIMESLIWTQTSPNGLCEEIVRYILKLHLQMEDEQLRFYGKGFSSVLPSKNTDATSFQAARQAFADFERDLRGLDDLPLQIRQVAAAAPELRSASTHLPNPTASNDTPCVMDTAIYFEASGKWPESIAAIQRTKAAFLVRIAALLEESKSGIACRVGLEETQTELENLAFLDVSYEEGFTFRLRIHSDLEEALLGRRAKDKTLDQHWRTQGAQLLASFRRLYVNLPLHTQTIATFCGRFPALSSTLRLVKHWFNCHRLSCHFLEETIELLALRTFLEPHPWQVPSSAMTGFLRTLQLLSKWDWRTEPLIMDFSGELNGSERSVINTKLEAWRKIDPGMRHTTLFVATSHDSSGTAYTIQDGRPWPAKVVATRMTILARSACTLVKARGVSLEPKALFQPSFKDYNVIIHLRANVLKRIKRGGDTLKHSHFKNLDERTGNRSQHIGQPPARALFKRLDTLFSGPLVFFHGAPDDMIITGIWNPQLQRRTFRVNLPCSFKPVDPNGVEASDSEELVEVDREGIIAEIIRIGGDCIDRVEVSE